MLKVIIKDTSVINNFVSLLSYWTPALGEVINEFGFFSSSVCNARSQN